MLTALDQYCLSYVRNRVKGTVSNISSDPPCEESRFTTVPLKALSDKVWIRFQCFASEKKFLFAFSLRKWLVLYETTEKLTEINTLWVRNTTILSTFLIRIRCQGFRNKKGICIFAWRVTWNYAYSPFNPSLDCWNEIDGVWVWQDKIQTLLLLWFWHQTYLQLLHLSISPRLKFKLWLKYGWFHLKLY